MIWRKCEEQLQTKYDNFNAHKKELTKKQDSRHNVLVDERGSITIDKTKNQLEHLYNDQRNKIENEYITIDKCPEITREEVEHTKKGMKIGKAIGPDELPTDIIRLVQIK